MPYTPNQREFIVGLDTGIKHEMIATNFVNRWAGNDWPMLTQDEIHRVTRLVEEYWNNVDSLATTDEPNVQLVARSKKLLVEIKSILPPE